MTVAGQDGEGLSPGASQLVEAVGRLAGNGPPGVHHWLSIILERHGPMVEALGAGLSAAPLQRQVLAALHRGEAGAPLDRDAVVRQAQARAQARGRLQASERDVAAVVLAAAGHQVSEPAAPAPSAPAAARPAGAAGTGAAPARTVRPTPTLDQFGRDLTRDAQQGRLSPVVGRETEVSLVVETLCRRTKRNPVLVGPAGVGKTAIVEGLAQRVLQGEVPEPLRGIRLIAIQPSSLVAGSHMVGELEKRMKAVLAEASQDGVILFIDEVHSIIGAGGAPGTSDVASLLKPALARGDLACIAATTDDEYRRFVEPDAALERRFQPIRVQELTAEQTLEVLATLAGDLARLRRVEVPEPVRRWLVDFAGRFLRNRHFPDKAVDLLEQCVAHALAYGAPTVTLATAEAVAQRMVGFPVSLHTNPELLRSRLGARTLLPADELLILVNRLAVTARGLDIRPSRPNAVVLLTGEAAAQGGVLATTLAETLFGAADRVVAIDFGRLANPADITLLIGAPPGYVGYADNLALHRVAQIPWCVVLGENLHAAHPQVRDILAQALLDGFLTDARGKRTYLSDAVVVLTAETGALSPRVRGFRRDEVPEARTARDGAVAALGAELVAQCDVVCQRVVAGDATIYRWIEDHLLTELSERYRRQGVELSWDDALIRWLMSHQAPGATQRDWERLVDERVSPLLIPHLPAAGAVPPRAIRLRCDDDKLLVETRPSQGGDG
jgi:ATP-dependent Clp protease ATP-binding subunit ClpC